MQCKFKLVHGRGRRSTLLLLHHHHHLPAIIEESQRPVRLRAARSPLVTVVSRPRRARSCPSSPSHTHSHTHTHMLEPVRPGAVLPDRTLCLTTFSNFLIVNKTSLSPLRALSPLWSSLSLPSSLPPSLPISIPISMPIPLPLPLPIPLPLPLPPSLARALSLSLALQVTLKHG